MSRDVVLYKTLIGGASYLQTRVLSCPLIDQHKYSEAKPPSARLNAATVARTLAAAGRQSKQLAASSAERVCVDAFTRGVERVSEKRFSCNVLFLRELVETRDS